jgi:hypothetical protein
MDMEKAGESTQEFRRHVAHFLTAARSVKDVLINEIAAGDPTVKKRIGKPIADSMKADSEMESLIDARNTEVHEGDLRLAIAWVPEGFPGRSTDPSLSDFFRRHRLRRIRAFQPHRSRMVGVPPAVEQLPRAFFDGIADRDAYTVCAKHFEKVTKATNECVQRYG